MALNLMTGNLLTSNGGVELPADICLRIVDLVIHDAPKNAAILLELSRSFKKLIKTYERSLIKNAVKLYADSYVNQRICLIARCRPKSSGFAPSFYLDHTFAWLLEVQTRAGMTHEIIQDNFSQCLTSNVYWGGGVGFDPPTLAIPRVELELRLAKFKEEAIKLLYEIWDATKGIKHEWRARTRQIDYLVKLSTPELAILCIFIPILGFNFYKKLRDDTMDNKRAVVVFQHNLIRYGPLFAWLNISPRVKCDRVTLRGTVILNDWFKEKQEEGVRKLKAFERGQTREASMIIVLWRIFQARMEVANIWSPRTGEGLWNISRQMVEEKMMGYVL
ncbi:Protein ccc1 [Ciborinia camelliae]|nr:Protein ccc1 [Ciborinia camelliae]